MACGDDPRPGLDSFRRVTGEGLGPILLRGWRGRLLGLFMVLCFAAVQYWWWADARRGLFFDWEPTPVLGPLYFLANKRTDDDWLGYVGLAVLAPYLLAFPCRPGRGAAALCALAMLAWVLPGIAIVMYHSP